jgi:hypothetical protein
MNTLYTSHAAILSEDKSCFYWEKNVRFDGKITFFWWKLEEWEDYMEWLLRELKEETWVDFKSTQFYLLEEKQSVIINDNIFIWNLYLIYATQSQIKTILNQEHGRNIELPSSSIDEIDFGFDELKNKLYTALNYKK